MSGVGPERRSGGRRRIYHPAVRRRLFVLLVLCALALVMAAVASAYVIAATPLAAARLAAEKPYLAYECGWKLHGVPDYCQGRLVVAVRKLPDSRWRGTGVKSFYIDNRGC